MKMLAYIHRGLARVGIRYREWNAIYQGRDDLVRILNPFVPNLFAVPVLVKFLGSNSLGSFTGFSARIQNLEYELMNVQKKRKTPSSSMR